MQLVTRLRAPVRQRTAPIAAFRLRRLSGSIGKAVEGGGLDSALAELAGRQPAISHVVGWDDVVAARHIAAAVDHCPHKSADVRSLVLWHLLRCNRVSAEISAPAGFPIIVTVGRTII